MEEVLDGPAPLMDKTAKQGAGGVHERRCHRRVLSAGQRTGNTGAWSSSRSRGGYVTCQGLEVTERHLEVRAWVVGVSRRPQEAAKAVITQADVSTHSYRRRCWSGLGLSPRPASCGMCGYPGPDGWAVPFVPGGSGRGSVGPHTALCLGPPPVL